MPSLPPSSSKPTYQLYCGVDIAAKTFTAATCKNDEEPTKASNFKQSPADYDQLHKNLLSSGVTPNQILVVMEATGSVIFGFAVNKRLVLCLDRTINHPFLSILRIT